MTQIQTTGALRADRTQAAEADVQATPEATARAIIEANTGRFGWSR